MALVSYPGAGVFIVPSHRVGCARTARRRRAQLTLAPAARLTVKNVVTDSRLRELVDARGAQLGAGVMLNPRIEA